MGVSSSLSQFEILLPGIWAYYWRCIGLFPQCKPIPSLKHIFCRLEDLKALAMVAGHVRLSQSSRRLCLETSLTVRSPRPGQRLAGLAPSLTW